MMLKPIALLVLLAAGMVGTAQAQMHPGGMMGSGMMGGYGMGPGMMDGGMGPGMMGGPGGCPMMGAGPLWQLNLTADQKKKIDALMTQQREQHWSIMRSMSDDYAKLRTLYAADPLDANAIGKVYDDIFKNQRAMIDSGIKARNQIYGMLTPEQKNQLKQYGTGGPRGPAR
jgi:Spy/CpxP family protein refolding chaperone